MKRRRFLLLPFAGAATTLAPVAGPVSRSSNAIMRAVRKSMGVLPRIARRDHVIPLAKGGTDSVRNIRVERRGGSRLLESIERVRRATERAR